MIRKLSTQFFQYWYVGCRTGNVSLFGNCLKISANGDNSIWHSFAETEGSTEIKMNET